MVLGAVTLTVLWTVEAAKGPAADVAVLHSDLAQPTPKLGRRWKGKVCFGEARLDVS